jgi:hypothetical protein
MVLFRKILNTKVAKMDLLIAKQILIFCDFKPYKSTKKTEVQMNLNGLLWFKFYKLLEN